MSLPKIESIAHNDGTPEMARKGGNAPHYMKAAPVMLGSWDVETVCGRNLGSSRDAEMTMGLSVGGTLCKRCAKIYADVLKAQDAPELPVDGPDTREESAPVAAMVPGPERDRAVAALWTGGKGDPVGDRKAAVRRERKRLADQAAKRAAVREAARGKSAEVIASTGLTVEEMREATEAFYANGGTVSPEILALPAPGTVNLANGTVSGKSAEILVCEFKSDVDVINPEKTHGKCPECSAYIPLLDVKSNPDAQRIGKHNVGGVSSPAFKGLSSRALDTVEHGSIPGDPATADKRRKAESLCEKSGKVARGAKGGTKECTGCARSVELREVKRTVKGEQKVTYRYPDHVRPRSGDSFVRAPKGERRVTPFGSGADAGKGQRDHGSVDGSAVTGSQNMAPVQPKGWIGTAGTGQLPATVRPGVDPEVSGDICPLPECGGQRKDVAHAGRSNGWRRRHSTKMGAYLRGRKAERDAQRAAQIESGEIIPASVKREARRAASVGSFADGNVNGTVTHTPRPEFAPKRTRKVAPNRKGGTKHTVRSGKAE